jgi:hypothetical protein
MNVGHFNVQDGETIWFGEPEGFSKKGEKLLVTKNEVVTSILEDLFSKKVENVKGGKWKTLVRTQKVYGQEHKIISFICRHEKVRVPDSMKKGPIVGVDSNLVGIFPNSVFSKNKSAFRRKVRKECKKVEYTTMKNTCFAMSCSDGAHQSFIWKTGLEKKVCGVEVHFWDLYDDDDESESKNDENDKNNSDSDNDSDSESDSDNDSDSESTSDSSDEN